MVIVPIHGQLPTYHALGNNTFAAEIHFTWKKQIRPIVQRHAMSHKKQIESISSIQAICHHKHISVCSYQHENSCIWGLPYHRNNILRFCGIIIQHFPLTRTLIIMTNSLQYFHIYCNRFGVVIY